MTNTRTHHYRARDRAMDARNQVDNSTKMSTFLDGTKTIEQFQVLTKSRIGVLGPGSRPEKYELGQIRAGSYDLLVSHRAKKSLFRAARKIHPTPSQQELIGMLGCTPAVTHLELHPLIGAQQYARDWRSGWRAEITAQRGVVIDHLDQRRQASLFEANRRTHGRCTLRMAAAASRVACFSLSACRLS